MRFVPLLLLLTLSGCHKPQPSDQPPAATQTAISTITTGHDGESTFPVVDNARFYVVPDYQLNSEKNVTLTLTEHIVTQVRTDRECCFAEINLSGAIDGRTVWTTRKKAFEGEMFGRFYRAIKPGCCGSATHYSYFDPLTGNQAFIATEPIASVGVVGDVDCDRYLALNRISEPGDDQFVLQIQYGPQSGPTQTIYLIHPGQDTAMSSTSVQYLQKGKLEDAYYRGQEGTYTRDFTLFPPGYPSNRNTSPDDITGFSFLLNVENSSDENSHESLKIPVIKDHLDFDHASLPKGFLLTNTLPADEAKYLEYIRE
jgi:hypothetical protein